MADWTIVEGGTFEYTVVATNKSGTKVPVTDVTVELTGDKIGSNSVAPDGSNGLFTSMSGAGSVVLTPSAAGVTGTPYSLDVTPDMVVTSVVILQTPAAVTVVPNP